MREIVSLPYGFTLFSNDHSARLDDFVVSLPYGFTLFSNRCKDGLMNPQFHYLMDLHYSQTYFTCGASIAQFHYLMDLHYSQTNTILFYFFVPFHYLMDLHYSQTSNKLRPLYSAGQIHKI